MHSQIKLGRIAGIEIGLHYSWFIIAILIALSLAGHFHGVRPDWSRGVIWTSAVTTAVLFFATLLMHELAHSIVAKSRGLRVRAITLFALGGVSQIESEATDAKSEFWIAIVGPVTSVVLGYIFVLLARASGWLPGGKPATPATAVLVWLGYINIGLAIFNMIPGFPLDGGRVLRAIAWWITGNVGRSTRIASQVGQGVAFLFILFGLYRFFVGANVGGLWLTFIGWFLLDAARSSYLQVGLMAELRHRRVSEIMESDCATVEGYLSLRDFVDQYLLHSASRCFVVVQDGRVAGLVTPAELKGVARENWPNTSVQSIMRPLQQVPAVSPEMPAVQALELMDRANSSQLAVISDGKLEGIFSRRQVLRFLQLYGGFGTE
jgi:Zn-dependent protease/predicted transcriptional regulator